MKKTKLNEQTIRQNNEMLISVKSSKIKRTKKSLNLSQSFSLVATHYGEMRQSDGKEREDLCACERERNSNWREREREKVRKCE